MEPKHHSEVLVYKMSAIIPRLPPTKNKSEGFFFFVSVRIPHTRSTMDPVGITMKQFGIEEKAQESDSGIISSNDDKENSNPLFRLTTTETSVDVSHWQRVLQIIHSNPSLLTKEIFFETLKRKPPETVVLQMLQVSPGVGGMPCSGPTPLHVALESGASIGVVRALLEICPFALCVSRSYDSIDPLLYAQLHRTEEADLIELLSRPLRYWLSQGTFHDHSHDRVHLKYDSTTGLVSESSHSPRVSLSPPTSSPVDEDSVERRGSTKASSVDRQELNNVKSLCTQVLRGHKKLSKQLEQFQTQYKNQVESSSRTSAIAAQKILATLKVEQEKLFRIQLMALEMKERAFTARAKKLEEDCIQHLDEQWMEWKKSKEEEEEDEDDAFQEKKQEMSDWKTLLRRHESVYGQVVQEDSRQMEVHPNPEEQEGLLVETNPFPAVFTSSLRRPTADESVFTNSLRRPATDEFSPLNVTSTSLSDEESSNDIEVVVGRPSSPHHRRLRGIRRFYRPSDPSVKKCFLTF